MLAVSAQQNERTVPRDESAFVVQAPVSDTGQVEAPEAPEANSKVYFPEAITPQSIANARARTAQQQLESANGADDQVAQVSAAGDGARDVDQLSDGNSAQALAQLSAAERQVLLEAVEGTDICDRSQNIPAIQALCDGRIETRSAEFSQTQNGQSAEESLLGEGLDGQRAATLEAAIARLARNDGNSDDFSNQVIASVALGSAAGVSDSQAASAEADPADDLSPETQALINAIVQQFGGN